jgi:thiol:disulfide interchange protein
MKHVVIAALVLSIWLVSACQQSGPELVDEKPTVPPVFVNLDYEAAKTKAASEDRMLLVLNTATWCTPCKEMDKTTWLDENVVAWVNEHAVAVRVDVDERQDLLESLDVQGMPTIILFRGDDELGRVLGRQSAEEMMAWFDETTEAGREESEG